MFVPGETEEPAEIELPRVAQPVTLPKATLRNRFASARATKWVMAFTFAILAILVLMTLIGPHIPAGE